MPGAELFFQVYGYYFLFFKDPYYSGGWGTGDDIKITTIGGVGPQPTETVPLL